MKCQPFAVGVP